VINGRHLLLLGLLACAGLLSVHDGQQQTALCYQIAAQEKELREIREQIELNRIKHTALQSPRAVMERAAELNLKVAPPSFAATTDTAQPQPPVPPPVARSLGSPQGARPAPATAPATPAPMSRSTRSARP